MRLLALAALLLIAPVASAQVPTSTQSHLAPSVDAPATPLAAGAPSSLPYRVTFTIEGPAQGTVTIVLSIPPPAGGKWTMTPEPAEHVVEVPPGLSFTATLEGAVVVTPAADAPALERVPAVLTAATDGTAVIPAATGDTNFEVRADWRPGLQITIPAPGVAVADAGGSAQAVGELLVTGNAPVRVNAEVVGGPRGCGALPPSGVQAQPGQRTSITIRLECGEGWASGGLTVRFAHALLVDTSREGEPVTAQWEVGRAGEVAGGERTYGDPPPTKDAPVGWAAAPLALAAAAALALARRPKA